MVGGQRRVHGERELRGGQGSKEGWVSLESQTWPL